MHLNKSYILISNYGQKLQDAEEKGPHHMVLRNICCCLDSESVVPPEQPKSIKIE